MPLFKYHGSKAATFNEMSFLWIAIIYFGIWLKRSENVGIAHEDMSGEILTAVKWSVRIHGEIVHHAPDVIGWEVSTDHLRSVVSQPEMGDSIGEMGLRIRGSRGSGPVHEHWFGVVLIEAYHSNTPGVGVVNLNFPWGPVVSWRHTFLWYYKGIA